MILEVAELSIKKGLSAEFERSFVEACPLIAGMKGYVSHELKKCLEKEDQYLLLVQWETVEDHEIGFRKSSQYKEWAKRLHHFYEPFPEVLHYR